MVGPTIPAAATPRLRRGDSGSVVRPAGTTTYWPAGRARNEIESR